MHTVGESAQTYRAWLARAERAYRIASTLSGRDADAVEAYAAECEAKALRHLSAVPLESCAA
jgi:hypothetical protein